VVVVVVVMGVEATQGKQNESHLVEDCLQARGVCDLRGLKEPVLVAEEQDGGRVASLEETQLCVNKKGMQRKTNET